MPYAAGTVASDVSSLTRLARFLPGDLVVVDIGCRWGFAPYWDWLVPYESTVQTLTMPGGQLIWCNAHYVRREVYETRSHPDWETRLRNACIAHVHGFHDLAFLSLRRLLNEGGPREMRDSIASVLEAMAGDARARRADPPHPSRRVGRVVDGARRRIARLRAAFRGETPSGNGRAESETERS